MRRPSPSDARDADERTATAGVRTADGSEVFDLEAETELRLEAPFDAASPLQLRLGRGTAEVLGRELALGQWYTLRPGQKLGVFTWHGCRVEVRGVSDVPPYVADETPLPLLVNFHDVLQHQREQWRRRGTTGAAGQRPPRVAVVGPRDSGKLTVASTLAAYALRHLGARLAMVDLDPAGGIGAATRLAGVPGSLCLASLERPLLPLEDAAAFERPMSFFYGHLMPPDNDKVYLALVEAVRQRLDAWSERVDQKRSQLIASRTAAASDGAADAPELFNAGSVVCVPAWIDSREGYEQLRAILTTVQPTCILVLESERLQALLKRDFDARSRAPATTTDASTTAVVRLPKSGGVVVRDTAVRRRERDQRFRAYFYGHAGELSPHSLWVSERDATMYKFGGRLMAPLTALPLGQTASAQDMAELTVLERPAEEMMHAIGAVSQAPEGEGSGAEAAAGDDGAATEGTFRQSTVPAELAERLLRSPAFGFVHVTAIDTYRSRLRLLCPSPGKLPSRYLHLSTDIRWVE